MNNTLATRTSSRFATLALAVSVVSPLTATALTTNWVAFNDHRPTAVSVASGWAHTADNVTGYDMGAPADLAASTLTDFQTGAALPATVSFTRTGAPDDFGTIGRPILTNTPMARIFYGICDLSNDGLVGVRAVPPNTSESFVTMTFGGLDPFKRYVFRGSVVRNGGYGNRWSVATISADGWTDAHINGNGGPGVLTGNNFPSSGLAPGAAAFNSGANNEGAVVGWNDIAPFPDGTFSIACNQYTGAIPGGTASGPYGYSFGAFMLAEVEVVAPNITANPPASTTVEQNRPFSLSVAATGAPLNYQWYKEGLGEIAGATFATYSVAQAQVGDSGAYYAVVYNALGRQTGTVAQVTVFQDTTAPAVDTIFSYPTVDYNGNATMNQIIIEFNEPVTPASVSSPSSYTVIGLGNPASVIVTNERSVVLVLATPLNEDTDYSVTSSGATDLEGNAAGSSSTSFHSWVSGLGNGLVMESYDVPGTEITVESLLASPNFPDNPFRQDLLRAFDSRLAFPDDTREGYGARISGVFIPPVSGDWVFFARTRNLGLVKLNPNGIDPAGAVEILRQSTENAPYNWDRLTSSLQPLRAGQPYYLEGLYKGATGPDYLKVAARLAGTGVPTPVDSPDTDNPDTNSLAGAFIASPLAPRDLGGPLTIASQPADVSTEDLHTATFSVQASNPSGLPISYQWYRDEVEIPGATGRSYSFQATLADSGATFKVRVATLGAMVMSETATLSVVPDVTPPTVIGARGFYPLNRAIVSFSEEVRQTSAEDLFSYGTDGTFGVLSATLDATRTNVLLTFDTLLLPDTLYPLVVNFVEDLSGQAMTEAANVTFRTWVISRGFALEELYLDIGAGTLVSDLTGSTKFPNAPDVVTWVTTLEGPSNTGDNYGTRLSGWLAPPVNGDYLLYVCSDDSSELRLSPNDDPAGLQLIAQETSYMDTLRGWTGDRAGGTRGTPPSNITTNPVPMTTGNLYAFEVLAKEGGGNDYAGVTWQVPGQPVPANGTPGIAGAHLYCLADPVGASVTITQQPSDFPVTTLPATATFSVGATATLQGAPNSTFLSYLWQRDDGAGFNDILGAYGSSYSVVVNQADVGARFRALVFSPGASATSAIATVGGTSAPSISISRLGNVIRVSWPLPGTGISLEQAPTLQGNPPPWTTVPSNTYQTDATSVYIEVISPTDTVFYRLRQ